MDKVNKRRNVVKSNYSEKVSEFLNGRRTHDLPEYGLDALITELWRTHGDQGRKLNSLILSSVFCVEKVNYTNEIYFDFRAGFTIRIATWSAPFLTGFFLPLGDNKFSYIEVIYSQEAIFP